MIPMKPIALDAMGGDAMPEAAVDGALRAAEAGIPVVLVGDEAKLQEVLKGRGELQVHHAGDVMTMNDAASEVRRRSGTRASCSAVTLVKEGGASACVSMGHSGATMAAALLVSWAASKG